MLIKPSQDTFYVIYDSIVKEYNLTPVDILVYSIIRSYCEYNGNEGYYGSVNSLAERINSSDKTVQRSLNRLISGEKPLLKRKQVKGECSIYQCLKLEHIGKKNNGSDTTPNFGDIEDSNDNIDIINAKNKENNLNRKDEKNKLSTAIRKSYKYNKWRNQVFERDNYTCQCCGIKSESENDVYLECHHLFPLSAIILKNNITKIDDALNCNEIFDISNGQTLCYECHKKTDSYGGSVKQYWKYYSC